MQTSDGYGERGNDGANGIKATKDAIGTKDQFNEDNPQDHQGVDQ